MAASASGQPNRIRLVRKAAGLSQKEFAALFSVDQTAVSNWELGKNGMDFSMADRIASHFALPVEYLYGKPYTLTRPQERWTSAEKEAYSRCATPEEKSLFEFRTGRGVFEGQRSAGEEEIKAALFGGDCPVTEEMWREVKSFVEYVKQRKKD